MQNHRQFHTPGIVYRPKELKNMTCLLGNTERRQIFDNFELKNLNKDAMDISHDMYVRYLQYNNFIPAGDPAYFAHLRYNVMPETASTEKNKGRFNVFPLSLASEELVKTSSTALGLPPPSPLPPLPPNPYYYYYYFFGRCGRNISTQT